MNISIGTDEEWEKFCKALGNPSWTRDKRFSDTLKRCENADELDRHIREWTQTRDPYEIMHNLQNKGIACGPVISEAGALCDPHLKQRNFFLDITHPDAK